MNWSLHIAGFFFFLTMMTKAPSDKHCTRSMCELYLTLLLLLARLNPPTDTRDRENDLSNRLTQLFWTQTNYTGRQNFHHFSLQVFECQQRRLCIIYHLIDVTRGQERNNRPTHKSSLFVLACLLLSFSLFFFSLLFLNQSANKGLLFMHYSKPFSHDFILCGISSLNSFPELPFCQVELLDHS